MPAFGHPEPVLAVGPHLGRQRDRGGDDVGGGHEAVQHPEGVRLGATEVPPGQHELAGAGRADDARQEVAHADVARRQTDADEDRTEGGVRSRDPEVAGEGERQPAADRRAVHGRHHGLVALVHGEDHLGQVLLVAVDDPDRASPPARGSAPGAVPASTPCCSSRLSVTTATRSSLRSISTSAMPRTLPGRRGTMGASMVPARHHRPFRYHRARAGGRSHPTDLWAALADLDRYPHWWSWLRLDHPPGALAPGVQVPLVIRPPLPYALRLEIRADQVEPSERIGATVARGPRGDGVRHHRAPPRRFARHHLVGPATTTAAAPRPRGRRATAPRRRPRLGGANRGRPVRAGHRHGRRVGGRRTGAAPTGPGDRSWRVPRSWPAWAPSRRGRRRA